MKILIFGATGMVGQGVLRECLLAPDVAEVVTLGRNATGRSDPKLTEIVHADLTDYGSIEAQLSGFDACFFCLGVASAGMDEASYRAITYDVTIAAAQTLVRLNAEMVFVYVSGTGTASSETGRWMWARVKGETENALLRLPFKAAYMFRPGMIRPLHGIVSKTALYRVIYRVLDPVFPALQRVMPGALTTTEQVGKAMLAVARGAASKRILENADINRL